MRRPHKKKKKINILSAINVESDRDNVTDLFSQYIVSSVVINSSGHKIDTLDTIEDALLVDVKKQYRDKTIDLEDKKFPLYIAATESQIYYITPVIGSGLWGPIWGFLAFEDFLQMGYNRDLNENWLYSIAYSHIGNNLINNESMKSIIRNKLYRQIDCFSFSSYSSGN